MPSQAQTPSLTFLDAPLGNASEGQMALRRTIDLLVAVVKYFLLGLASGLVIALLT